MSLLTICQGAARAARVPAPTMIVNNTADTAQLLLQLANDEGEALARRRPGGWVAMVKEYDFTTQAVTATGNLDGTAVITGISPGTSGLAPNTWHVFGAGFPNNTIINSVDSGSQVTCNQATGTTETGASLTFGLSDYALPSDFERAVDGTFWDRSRFWQMRGSMSPQQWQLFKSSVLGYSATVQRRYRIRNVAGTVYLSLDPVPTDNGSQLVFEYVSNAWCKSSGGAVQTSWQADTDLGVLDEYLIRLGVRWRLLERLGMAYDAAQQEYEEECDKAVAHDGGTQVIDMVQSTRLVFVGPYNVPETGFGS